jgi:hypothetical protein
MPRSVKSSIASFRKPSGAPCHNENCHIPTRFVHWHFTKEHIKVQCVACLVIVSYDFCNSPRENTWLCKSVGRCLANKRKLLEAVQKQNIDIDDLL